MREPEVVKKFVAPDGRVFKFGQRVEWTCRYRGTDNPHSGYVEMPWSDGMIYVIETEPRKSDNCLMWWRFKHL